MGDCLLAAALLQALEDALEDDGSGDFAVGGLGDDEGAGTLDDVVGEVFFAKAGVISER